MDYGLFTMPSHPPERSLYDGHQWDLQQLRWADELGFSEAWIGEHHTAPWEPHPAPDLLVAQALMQTTRMRIGPGGFLMPYHHPAELANRVAMLDHLAQGRLNFGVAGSGRPSDWARFNVDGNAGQHREMTREALDVILRLWGDEPEFEHKGKYWHVTKTGTMLDTLKPHIVPLQRPHPPIGVAGVSKGSDTLKLAGERGFWPMSLNLNPAYVASHWESVEQGAARTGRTPKRADWRLVREVFIADTDAEAMRLSAGGMVGRMLRAQARSPAHVVDDRVSRLVLEMEMSKAPRLKSVHSVLTIVREPARGPSTANGGSDADSIAAVVSRVTQASDLIGLVPNAPAVRILLVDTHLDDVSGVIERVRAEFSPEVTLSFGASCFPSTGSTTAELLRRADLEAGLVSGG